MAFRALLFAFAITPALASGAATSGTSDRVIIKLRTGETGKAAGRMSPQAITALSQRAGFTLQEAGRVSDGVYVLRLPHRFGLPVVAALSREIARADGVEYAEPDPRLRMTRTPNDPLYGNQWHYHSATVIPGGANLPPAWEVTTGDPAVIVAVVDSGWLPHADLAGRTIPVAGKSYPYGYDFVSDAWTANDGGGRDPNPADPGDWVTAAEANADPECTQRDSSWHGTHVTGTLAAASDNGTATAGVDWQAGVIPVRVLGKCGGFTSDVAAAIRWAAGGAVPDAPVNTHPAQVINLSLGGRGSCPQTLQDAIDSAIAAGAVVIAAAGNSAADVAEFMPANCAGVIPVAASDRAGSLASYSNIGMAVALTAPGGRSPANAEGILSLSDGGARSPAYDNAHGYNIGTSMAAPHVSGAVSLMMAAHAAAGGSGLTPARIRQKLRDSARPFPSGSGCTTSLCGAGLLDTAAAVRSVSTAPVADAAGDRRSNPGDALVLDGSGSSDDGAIVTWRWRQTDLSGITATLSGAASRQAVAHIPSHTPLGTRLTFELTVTDDVGLAATDSVEVRISPPLLAPIGDRTIVVGERLAFEIHTLPENVLAPALSASGLPAGARFEDYGNGSGGFEWIPSNGGVHAITFTVADGGEADSEQVTITAITTAASGSTTSGASGGGGGAISPLLLFHLLARRLRRARRYHRM